MTSGGTYTPPAGTVDMGLTRPLFLQQTENLGQSRYEGIELAVQHAVPIGFGWKIQGDLMRAYTYNLPASFYATGAGPDTTNLAVIPNVNYYPSGDGYNGIGAGRIPYATGYAEINYSSPKFSGQLGIQYYGNNNAYNNPAFGVVSASIRYTIDRRSWLQLAANNLTGAYSMDFPIDNGGGTPIPLADRKFGWTSEQNIGPTTFNLTFHHDFGAK